MSRAHVAIVGLLLMLGATQLGGGAQESPSDILTHFKYGAVGTEVRVGLPYPAFRAMPLLCADKLPARPGKGYEKLGFLYESPGAKRPIGTTYNADKIPLVGLNCATCHAGSYRESPGAPRRIVLGMPANQMDLQGYARFLTACAQDERFTASNLIDAIQKDMPEFSWFDRLIYRVAVFNRIKKGILERAQENAWFDSRPPQLPGRVDTFSPYKRCSGSTCGTTRLSAPSTCRRCGNSASARGCGCTGTATTTASKSATRAPPSALARRPSRSTSRRSGGSRRGSSTCRRRRSRPSGSIACARSVDAPPIRQPARPATQSARRAIGQVTDLAEIGTDPERLQSFTAELSTKMNTIGEGHPWKFSHFRKTTGYANMPLDGLWLRAPYLHNGSVPTLRALLFPEERPVEFYRAYDVFDWADVGFVWRGAEAEREGVKFDTRVRGNGNAGHTYGQQLSRGEREDLLEYLKTL